MSNKSKKSRKTVEQIMTEAQAISLTGPIDHETQVSSWVAPDVSEEIQAAIEAAGDAELLDVEIELEVQEVQATSATEADETPAMVETDKIEGSFDDLIAALDPAQVDETVVNIAEQIDVRAEFEARVAPDNENIHKTLKKVRAAFTASKNAARVMLATSVDPNFLNRSIAEGARYNVYALGKFADIVGALTDRQINNAINMACMKSLFLARNNKVPFTSNMAKACASDKLRDIEPSVKKWLVRHTVSASTAPTQASSTMQALETLGIVTRTGTRRDSIYTLTNHPAVAKLEKKLGLAA
jgi:hypothetical protein